MTSVKMNKEQVAAFMRLLEVVPELEALDRWLDCGELPDGRLEYQVDLRWAFLHGLNVALHYPEWAEAIRGLEKSDTREEWKAFADSLIAEVPIVAFFGGPCRR